MIPFALRRLLLAAPVFAGVSLAVFLMIHLIPGDPERLDAGLEVSPEDVEGVRRALGLHEPLPVQYGRFLGRCVTGDLGRSLKTGRPVGEEIAACYGHGEASCLVRDSTRSRRHRQTPAPGPKEASWATPRPSRPLATRSARSCPGSSSSRRGSSTPTSASARGCPSATGASSRSRRWWFSTGPTSSGATPSGPWPTASRRRRSASSSPTDRLADQFLPGTFDPPSFSLTLAHKDVALAAALGREVGVPMRLANLVLEEMTEALNRGWGPRDSRISMLLQEERAGIHIAVPPEQIREALAEDG